MKAGKAMKQIDLEAFLLQSGAISLSKAAIACSMISNDQDDDLIELLESKGIRAVITRAGGSGDNLKSKILRNSFGAAENSGLTRITMKNRYAIANLVESILRTLEGPLSNVAGGGLKIGITVRGTDMAMAVYGQIGLAGLDIDYEVSGSRILYHCLEE